MLPWRVKRFLAYRFPLAYACAINGRLPLAEAGDGSWLEKHWDDPAWDWPRKRRIVRELTKPTDRILDVGTGTGSILRYLHGEGYQHLAAVDAAAYPLRRLSTLGIDARQGVLPSIPFEDGAFDLVIASQVLEHVVRRHRFMREIARVLAPGGRAAIFVPDWCLSPLDEPTHVAVYHRRSLTRLLARHFEVESVESIRDDAHRMNVLYGLVRAAG